MIVIIVVVVAVLVCSRPLAGALIARLRTRQWWYEVIGGEEGRVVAGTVGDTNVTYAVLT